MIIGCDYMSDELYSFLGRNGIEDINDFIKKSNFNIDGLQSNISNVELYNANFKEQKQITIPLSKILGFNESNCKIDKSFFANFSNFFDSSKNEQYYNRGIGMLGYHPEDIMVKLSESFDDEPINTIGIEGKYYISSNGLHRFMALKLYYMLEIYQGKTPEELDQKYMIKVNNRELDVFKTFTYYLGSNFKPSIKYDENISESQWFEKVKERIQMLNENDYQLLISNLAFSHFINDTSGEVMIKFLFNTFPIIGIDIFKHLIMKERHECITNIINCIKKYFPSYEAELLQIIHNDLNYELMNTVDNNFEHSNLDQQSNGKIHI